MVSSATAVTKRLYVGNLPFSCTESELRAQFERFGRVHSARVVVDRETQRPRGFGFVILDDAAAEAAIRELDGVEHSGRPLRVSEALRQPDVEGAEA